MKMIKIKTDILDELTLSEFEFRIEAKGMISFAINEKGYKLEEIDANMIAEDITGLSGRHEIPEEGMKIIEEELQTWKNNVNYEEEL